VAVNELLTHPLRALVRVANNPNFYTGGALTMDAARCQTRLFIFRQRSTDGGKPKVKLTTPMVLLTSKDRNWWETLKAFPEQAPPDVGSLL
jgi:hypothetical protein